MDGLNLNVVAKYLVDDWFIRIMYEGSQVLVVLPVGIVVGHRTTDIGIWALARLSYLISLITMVTIIKSYLFILTEF